MSRLSEQRYDYRPGDLDVDTVFLSTWYERKQLPSRDYQLVVSPPAQHWVKRTGEASAAASAAGAIQGLLRCQAANGAVAVTLKQEDALGVRQFISSQCAVSALHSKSPEAQSGRGHAAGVHTRRA